MAKAVKETVVTTTETVVLTLSIREAEVLRELCRRVSGDAGNTARGYTDNIDAALEEANVKTGVGFFSGSIQASNN